MRKCEGTSKAAMKAKRAHAEMKMQYGHPDTHIHTHMLEKAPHLDKELRFLLCSRPVL
jgi:hypothetical protein